VVETAGHPVVIARSPRPPRAPHLLIYGHYDVVPPGPRSAWRTPPFQPSRRGAYLYGRGASDDKGPLFCHLAAIAAWTTTAGAPPVPLTCVFEGEEEIGSPSLGNVLRRPELRGAVAAVISDTRMRDENVPTIVTGLRGTVSLEVDVLGAQADLHSGAFGDTVPNAADAACRLVASLHDHRGRITVPGFHHRVRRPSTRARERVRALEPALVRAAGGRLVGEPGWSAIERTVLRPSLTVTGIRGGHTGPGAKSIIPGAGRIMLQARLVPAQDPREIANLVGRHLRRAAPPCIDVRVRAGKLVPPVVVPERSRWVEAARRAAAAAFGTDPALAPSGGTIPVAASILEILRIQPILLGFALPDDRMHGPNERFHLPTFHRGVATCIRLYAEVARELARRGRTSATDARELVVG
jgi:acetylornithine deacetylase/succinyl-diaminopimelate desuccinylase-like protein